MATTMKTKKTNKKKARPEKEDSDLKKKKINNEIDENELKKSKEKTEESVSEVEEKEEELELGDVVEDEEETKKEVKSEKEDPEKEDAEDVESGDLDEDDDEEDDFDEDEFMKEIEELEDEDEDAEEDTEDDSFEDELKIEKEDENKIALKSKSSKKEIDQKLAEIYENSDGSMPDMKNFKQRKKSRFLTAFLVLLVSCLFLGAVAWLGFFILEPRSNFSEQDVILSISGDDQVAIGEEVEYRVRYRNSQNVPLAQSSLEVKYPKGFVFLESSEPATNDKNDEWALGTIDAQGGGFIDIKGVMYGNLNEKQSFRTFLNYKPSNFSSQFQKVESFTVETSETSVELIVESSDKVLKGAENEILIKIKPTESSIDNVFVVLEPSENYNKKSSDPASIENDEYVWSIGKLEEEKTVKLVGSFQGGDGVTEDKLKFKVLVRPENRDNDEYILAEEEKIFVFAQNEVSLQLVVNGSMGESSIAPGEMLSTSLAVRNLSKSVIKNVEVKLTFDAPSYQRLSLLHWAEIEDDEDGDIVGEQLSDSVRRGMITWNSRHVSDFKQLDPGEEILIDVHLPLKTIEEIDLTKFTAHNISINAEVSFGEEGARETVNANQIKLVANSDVGLEVKDKINDVDGKNEHVISWVLNNSFHELKDIKLEADVYGNVTWKEEKLNVPGGNVEYNQDGKKIIWTIGSMPTSVDVLALQFGLLLNEENPSQTNLTSKVKFSATDVVTGQKIILVGDEVLLEN